MEINKNESAAIKALTDYLSLLQLKYDCETVCSLIHPLKHDGIAAFGMMPYISLTTVSILEILALNESEVIQIPNTLQIKDVRLKLKLFEDGYSKSKKMILNTDFLQDQVYKNMLKFKFMRNWNIHQNLGIYTDTNKRVIGNTQYNYYLLQDNRLLKKSIAEVAEAYSISPDKFDLNKQANKELYEYGYKCGQIIGSIRSELKSFDVPVSIAAKGNPVDYYYADYNTNIKSSFFPTGEDSKATVLYLLHMLSTINFLIYILNNYEKDDYGWWLKVNYITYYYTIHKLSDLQQHLIQNRLITPDIADYFDRIGLQHPKYMNGAFRNYVMHSKLIDKDGNIMIHPFYLDKSKPLFGLVESCFDGISYQELKLSIITEMTRISDVLSCWLGIQSLQVKPLKP